MSENPYYKWRVLREFGGVGESIFIDDYLNFLKIPYKDVRDNIIYRKMEVDYILYENLKCEVKTTNATKHLFFNEYKIDKRTNEKKTGWFYYSKSDLFVFILFKMRKIIFLPRTDNFYLYYSNEIKNSYPLVKDENKATINWYRKVPLSKLKGFYSEYKRFL